MLAYTEIETILFLYYLNKKTFKNVISLDFKYNGFSHYGPYEDNSLDTNKLLTINGDGSLVVHNNGVIDSGRVTIYVAGSHTDQDYRINKEQLYTLAAIIEIIDSKFKRNYSISMDIIEDYSDKKFDLYRKNIKDLLVNTID